MDTIVFTTYQLVIENQLPSFDIMEQLVKEAPRDYEKHGEHYKMKQRIDSIHEYYFLCSEYGKPLPLPEELFDVEVKTTTKNLRRPNQVELRNQLFALYSFKTNLLYLSNARKSGFLAEYVKQNMKKDVCIKKIYVSAEEFLMIIKLVTSIRLVSYNSDLFSRNTGLFDEAGNIFGLGQQDQLCLEVKYHKANLTDAFKELFKNWITRKDKLEIDNLVCVGYDDHDMEVVFNTDSFSNKIEIKAQKNPNGMFLDDFVEQALIKKIG